MCTRILKLLFLERLEASSSSRNQTRVYPVPNLSSARWLSGTNVFTFWRPQGRPCALLDYHSSREDGFRTKIFLAYLSGSVVCIGYRSASFGAGHRSFRRAITFLEIKGKIIRSNQI